MSHRLSRTALNPTINLILWPNFALILCLHPTNTLYFDHSDRDANTMLICTKFNL